MTDIYELDLDWDFVNHLADPEAFAVIRAERISPELIEDEYVKKVFDWQTNHFREWEKPATGSALEASFDELAISEPLTTVGDCLQRLRDRYARNAGRKAIKSLAEVYKADPLTLADSLVRQGRELSNLTRRRGESWGTGDHDRSMQEYHKHVLKGPGPSLGFKELDSHFYGQRGVTFLLAPPKGAKTWLCVNAALANILEGKHVWIDCLEIPAYEMNMRLRCMVADIPWWKFLKGRLEKSDIKRLKEASDLLDSSGTFQIVSPPVGERDTKQLVQQGIDSGADVIFIDQLQYLQDSQGRRLGDANDPGAYWGVGDDLREFSTKIPIFVVHQFNRSVINADEMPVMQQAKGGSMVEEVGTLVLGAWANKDMRNSNILELGTLASRNYAYASWELKVNMNSGCNFEMVGEVEQ